MTYGDGVADVDIGSLVDFHRAGGRLATMTAVRPFLRSPTGYTMSEKASFAAWSQSRCF
jgi:NDP-sugar pyrophosphorylase family protein